MNSNLFKKKDHVSVYSILVYQCEKALEAANLLSKLMETQNHDLGDKIEQIEIEADKRRSELIQYVENTYITPLDRRDLYALSRTLDDITDLITDAKIFLLYFDYTPSAYAKKAITFIIASIEAITDAMNHWTELSTSSFLAKIKMTEKNETKVKELLWKGLKETESEVLSKEELISYEYQRHLNNIAAMISKAGDRMGDLKIKSIK